MAKNDHENLPTVQRKTGRSGALKVALLMVAMIAAFYVLREHWSHVASKWIYLLLLACPLIHLFYGHGGHDGGSGTKNMPRDKLV